MSEVYTVKVEEGRPATSDGRPSVGPVYRCIYAKDGLMEFPSGLESPWDFFRSIFYLLICFMSLMLINRNYHACSSSVSSCHYAQHS